MVMCMKYTYNDGTILLLLLHYNIGSTIKSTFHDERSFKEVSTAMGKKEAL